MMYFNDFEIYKYKIPFEIPTVSTIGWLDSSHSYPKGSVSNELIDLLWKCVENRNEVFDLYVNCIRGVHPCNICGEEVYKKGHNLTVLGMSEIWIPHEDGWFASPSLLVHYVEVHKYSPPIQYVEALRKIDFQGELNSEKAFEDMVKPIMLKKLFD